MTNKEISEMSNKALLHQYSYMCLLKGGKYRVMEEVDTGLEEDIEMVRHELLKRLERIL